MNLRLFLPAVMLAIAAASPAAAAQPEATPPGVGEPDRGECDDVEPRTVDDFEPYAADTEPALDLVLLPAYEPEGEPLDGAEGREAGAHLTEIVSRLYACYNAGDAPRLLALFTDEYFERLYNELGPLPRERLDVFDPGLSPQPIDQPAAILEVSDVRRFADERLAALVVIENPLLGDLVRETMQEAGQDPHLDGNEFHYETVVDLDEGRIDDMTLVGAATPGENEEGAGEAEDASPVPAAGAKVALGRSMWLTHTGVPASASRGAGKEYWCCWWPYRC